MLESLFNNVACLKACNFIEKRLTHRCFPVQYAKFLTAPTFTEHLRWLLLKIAALKSSIKSTNNIYWRDSNLIKFRLSPSKKNCFICFKKNLLKMMKNAVYIILKVSFVLKIFKFFVLTFWLCRKKKRLD